MESRTIGRGLTLKIGIAGATGTVGRLLVDAATARGHEVVGLSRSSGVDVFTGSGLIGVLEGTQAVIDVTNTTALSARTARRFFETSTGNLLDAEERVGVTHHLTLSIVGIDQIDAAYYAGKLAQERSVAKARVPYTIVRSAQFHEFAAQQLGAAKGPIAFLPRLLMRPVAAREVAVYLVEVVEGGPQKRARDLVGPCDEVLADLARRQLRADGVRRRVVEVPIPGRLGRGMASGSLRGTPPYREGTVTFDEWLSRDSSRR
jgi:uncharacterized protein YbjT (DUF2867 family)